MKNVPACSLKRFKAHFLWLQCLKMVMWHVIVVLPLKSWMSTRMSRYLFHVILKLGSKLLALMLPGTLGLSPESAWKKSGSSGTQKKIQFPASCKPVLREFMMLPSGYKWTHWITRCLRQIRHKIMMDSINWINLAWPKQISSLLCLDSWRSTHLLFTSSEARWRDVWREGGGIGHLFLAKVFSLCSNPKWVDGK